MSRLQVIMSCLILAGCSSSTMGPDGNPPDIRMHVTGGFAGVDYTVVLEGRSGRLVGEECVAFCEFQDGDVLRVLAPEQVSYLMSLFLDADIHVLDGMDFGNECCDQFHFALDYDDTVGSSSVQGSSEALPGKLRAAVSAFHGLVFGTLPMVVDFDTRPNRWPSDHMVLEEAAISGDYLEVRVSYGGGCRTHDIQAVAWGGWMESFPVQVKVFLSHDDRNDPCDAWITRDIRFDLVPLKRAYEESYGVSDPGTTTILIGIDSIPATSSKAWLLEYVF